MSFHITSIEIFIAAIVLIFLFLGFSTPARRKAGHVVSRSRLRAQNDLPGYDDGSAQEDVARIDGNDKVEIGEFGAVRRERFVAEWETVQSSFVDHPTAAVMEADDLITSLLEARGYPGGRFERRTAGFSVTYPQVMGDYRVAHAIAERHCRGEASTEELRTAMIRYRDIFDELIQKQGTHEKMPAA